MAILICDSITGSTIQPDMYANINQLCCLLGVANMPYNMFVPGKPVRCCVLPFPQQIQATICTSCMPLPGAAGTDQHKGLESVVGE